MKKKQKTWRQRCLSNPDLMFTKAYLSARRRATTRGVPFDISPSALKDKYVDQNGLCHYSKMPIVMIKRDPSLLHDPFKMTLDRIDPEKGYVLDNIVWCAYCVNSMKQRMPLSDFLKVCRAIVDNFKNEDDRAK